eukprot:7708046-Alexandrium_andersonii.AAC.1
MLRGAAVIVIVAVACRSARVFASRRCRLRWLPVLRGVAAIVIVAVARRSRCRLHGCRCFAVPRR